MPWWSQTFAPASLPSGRQASIPKASTAPSALAGTERSRGGLRGSQVTLPPCQRHNVRCQICWHGPRWDRLPILARWHWQKQQSRPLRTVLAQDLATLSEGYAAACACLHCAAAVHSNAILTAPFVAVTGPSPQRPVRGLRGYPSHSSSLIQRDDHLTASFSCLVRRRSMRA